MPAKSNSNAVTKMPAQEAERRASPSKKVPKAGVFDQLGLVGLASIEPVVIAALATESPLLLIGTHGSAKSLLLERIADALGLDWRHYNASLVSYDDLVGYPLPDAQGQLRFVETPASVWGAQAVFIDEIARARPDMLNRLFPVIHERRVQGLPLTGLRHRWAAMNPPPVDDDEESPYLGNAPLDIALSDRFALQVRMPDWRGFTADEQEAVIAAAGTRPLDGAEERLKMAIDDAARHLPAVRARWDASAVRYVRLLAGLLEEGGLVLSGRRAGMLQKNVVAIHAARIALGLCKDSVTGLGDAAWLALLNSLPFEAAGQKVERPKLLACHKEAWRQAAASPDDPMTRILAHKDPVERVRLALAAEDLPEGELTAIVTDALAALPEGRRHALAEWLFESDAVGRLSVVAADEAARAYRELACLQEVHEQVTPNGQRHRAWKRIQERLGVLQPESPASDRVANLLTALFSSGRLDEETDIDRVLDSFLDTRRQLAAEAA